ncbi:MAG: PAS domain S-box protein [Desulfobacterales bacterium]|nr:PAS domain S-box protein [Desulfobacterales bacterium]
MRLSSFIKKYTAVFVILFACLAGTSSTASANNPHVLIIASYHLGFGATDPIIEGIKTAFSRQNIDVDFYFEYLDTKRFSPDTIFPDMEALYRNKFSNETFDIIIVTNNNALNFILNVRDQIFPGTPVIFCGINNYRDEMIGNMPLITGVAEDVSLKETVSLALGLHPGTTHLAVISDSTTTGKANLEKFMSIAPELPQELNLIDLGNLSANALARRLKSLPEHTIILQLSFYMDAAGEQFTQKEQMDLILRHCDKPVYSAWDFFIAYGVIGGVVTYFPLQGETAANMAIQVLNGVPVSDIAVVKNSPNIPLFDYTALKQHHISLSALSPGTKVLNLPKTFYHENKQLVWIIVIFVIVQFAVIFVLFINVIRRKKTEKLLSESEEKYRSVFEQAYEGIILVNSKDGRIVEFNQAAHDHLDYTRAEFQALTVDDIHGDVQALYTQSHLEQIKTAGHDAFEAQHKTKTGQMRDVLISSHALTLKGDDFFVSMIQDITERKHTERSLKQYARIVSATSDLMSFIDDAYVYQAVNEAYLTAHQKKSRDIVGRSIPDLMGAQVFEKTIKANIDRCLSGETVTYKSWFDYKGSGRRYMEVTYFPYADTDANITGIVVNSRDITDRKKLEEQLVQSQKMESIGTLAGGIAHEFNNILSIIIGNNELIMEDMPEWSLTRTYSDEIRQASLRARDIVKHLLTFSRQDRSAKTPIDMASVVSDAVKLIRTTTPTNIEIRENISRDCLPINGNTTQIHQILINLCSNALDALPATNGTIDIALFNTETENEINGLAPGKFVNLIVRDNGSGINREILPRIFEPYFTTKEVGEGSGIGLAVVHGIVENHGGAITCDSRRNQGTTFSILLPACEGTVSKEILTAGPALGGGEHILYVDDEPALVQLGERHLKSLGYHTVSTTDPHTALNKFKENPDRFDLVITDMAMPKMPGDRLIEQILAIRPDMPTIICTGYSSRVSETEAEQIGAQAFLMKPLEKSKLAEQIRAVLDKDS